MISRVHNIIILQYEFLMISRYHRTFNAVSDWLYEDLTWLQDGAKIGFKTEPQSIIAIKLCRAQVNILMCETKLVCDHDTCWFLGQRNL